MTEKKNILLRLDKELHASIAQWAADDLRSINGQIEFILAEAVKRAGRRHQKPADGASPPSEQP